MEVALGKYQIIDSNSQKIAWNRNDKLILKGILLLLLIGIGVATSQILDKFFPKETQFILAIFIPILLIIILFQVINKRKPFSYSNQELYFYPHRILIKSQTTKEIPVKDIKTINFSFNGEDSGFYHPIFNPQRKRGNMNFISINLGNEIIRKEIYLPKKSEKIRLENILRKYEKLQE